MHSDTPAAGEFDCSDPLVNQLWSNIHWGQRGNFLAVPTDCPQRDERLGWTGDAQVFVPTAALNIDVAAFFTKWATTSSTRRRPTAPSDVVPRLTRADGAAAWADAGVIVPWPIYRCYGDRALLERHWDAMERYMAYIRPQPRPLGGAARKRLRRLALDRR